MPQQLNSKWRPPVCPITRAMAEAGKAKMESLMSIEEEAGVTDDMLVAEVFSEMWKVYWTQVHELNNRKVQLPPHSTLLAPQGLIRN